MRRATIIGALVAVALALPASASAAFVWEATVRAVRHHLVTHYKTSDGANIHKAFCGGVWSAPHHLVNGTWEFHKLNCSEVDAINRIFLVHVTVIGFQKTRVVEYRCNDRYSNYACP